MSIFVHCGFLCPFHDKCICHTSVWHICRIPGVCHSRRNFLQPISRFFLSLVFSAVSSLLICYASSIPFVHVLQGRPGGEVQYQILWPSIFIRSVDAFIRSYQSCIFNSVNDVIWYVHFFMMLFGMCLKPRYSAASSESLLSKLVIYDFLSFFNAHASELGNVIPFTAVRYSSVTFIPQPVTKSTYYKKHEEF